MLTTKVFIVGQGDVARTEKSIKIASGDFDITTETLGGSVVDAVSSAEVEAVQFIRAGDIVLPEFYRAMLTSLEYEGMDFASCLVLSLTGDGEVREDPSVSNMVIRRWAVLELERDDLENTVEAAVFHYRSTLVPHVLVVEG